MQNSSPSQKSLNQILLPSSSRSLELTKLSSFSFNEVFHRVGDSGIYQYRLLIFFSVQMTILSTLMLSGPFLFPAPKFNCNGITCNEETGGCEDMIFLSQNKFSVVHEFNLYCDRRYLRVLAESIFFVGSIIGTVFFTFFQMRRKRYLILSWIITLTGLIFSGFAVNIEMFLFFWGLTGFGAYACYIMSNTLMKEESTSKFYQKASVFLFIAWGLSQIIFSLIFSMIEYWRYLILIFMAIPAFFLIWGIFFIKESPRYLFYAEIKLFEALEILNEIAEINGKKKFTQEEIEKITGNFSNEKKKTYNYLHLFRFKSLRCITISTFLVNMVFNISYYGIQFSFSKMGLDLFYNALFTGIAEVFAYILAFFTITKIERKLSVFLGYFFTAIICLLFIFDHLMLPIVETILMFLARMIVAFVHCIIVLYFPEVYPTNIRLIGVGFVNLMGRIGNIGASWLAEYSEDILGNSMVSIGIICIIGCFSAFFMKETFNLQTQDYIDEEKEEN